MTKTPIRVYYDHDGYLTAEFPFLVTTSRPSIAILESENLVKTDCWEPDEQQAQAQLKEDYIMNMPGFTGEDSLHRSNRDNGVTGASGQVDMAVQSALIIPINICARFPWLCQPLPAINVSWLNCHTGSGYVLVRGSNFAANSGVQVDVGNCSGPFPVKTGSTTDANGSFTSWVSCDCSGSTTVNAIDSAGNTAQGSSAMPC